MTEIDFVLLWRYIFLLLSFTCTTSSSNRILYSWLIFILNMINFQWHRYFTHFLMNRLFTFLWFIFVFCWLSNMTMIVISNWLNLFYRLLVYFRSFALLDWSINYIVIFMMLEMIIFIKILLWTYLINIWKIKLFFT